MPFGSDAQLQVKVGMDIEEVRRGSQETTSILQGLTKSFTSGLGFGAGLAAVTSGLKAIGGGADLLKQGMIGLNQQLDNASIAFTAMLGNADKARGFMQQLQSFANSTPFEFPGLVQGAQRLENVGIQANAVIPLLKNVGDVAARSGQGAEGVDRITLALSQMQSKGKVSGGEMLQLTEAQVPAWNILAEHIGKSVDETMKLGEQGKISSATMLEAFQAWANQPDVAGQMALQAKTFGGAVSNIHDGIMSLIATGTRPLYDEITKVANVIGNFLTSDTAREWAAGFATVLRDAIQGVEGFISSVRGMKSAVEDTISGIKNAWDFRSILGGATGAVGEIIHEILALFNQSAADMVQGGYNTMIAYGKGIVQAGQEVINAVVNIAREIGSYFIGQSPPPNGPLKEIANGGHAVMQAYIGGMADEAHGGLSAVADNVKETLSNLSMDAGKNMGDVVREITSGGLSLDDMKDSALGVADAIGGIQGAIDEISGQLNDLKLIQSEIEDKYQAQLDPLQAQLDKIKEITDYSKEQQSLELHAQELDVKLRMNADPRSQELDDQIRTLQRQASGMHAPTGKGVTQGQRDSAQSSKDAITARIQALQDEKRQIDEGYQSELKGITIKKDQLSLEKERAKVANDILRLPLQKRIADIKDKEDTELDPIKKKQAALERQSQELNLQKQHYDTINKFLSQQITLQTQAADAAKKAAGAGGGLAVPKGGGLGTGAGGGSAIGGMPKLDVQSLLPPEKQKQIEEEMKAKGRDIANRLEEGFITFAKEHIGSAIGGILGTVIGGAIGGPWGARVGSLLGSTLGNIVQKHMPEIKKAFSGIASFIEEGIANVKPVLEQFGHWFTTTALPAIQAFAKEAGPIVADALRGIGAFIRDEAIPALKAFSAWFATEAVPAITSFVQAAAPVVKEIFQNVGSFITQTALPALRSFATWFMTDALPPITAFAGGVKMFFTDQIMPAIMGIVHTVLPALIDAWNNIKPSIMPAIGAVVETVKGLSETLGGIIKGISGFIHEHGDTITRILKEAWNGISAYVKTVIGIVSDVIKIALDLISGNWHGAWDAVKDILKTAWDGMNGIVDAATKLLKDVLRLAWEAIETKAHEIWDGIKKWLLGQWDDYKTEAGNKFAAIGTAISEKWDAIKKGFDDGKQALMDLVMWPFNQVDSKIGTIAQSIRDKIKGPFNEAGKAIHGFASAIGGAISWVGNKLNIGGLQIGDPPAYTELATGHGAFQGGPALVGERGRELYNRQDGSGWQMADKPTLLNLPKDGIVLPNAVTEDIVRMGVPGFFLGLNVDDIPGVKGAMDLFHKGADWLLNFVTDKFGLGDAKVPGIFSGIGGALVSAAKEGLLALIKGGFDHLVPAMVQPMISFAESQAGLPYIWGGGHGGAGGPGVGWDCSGFVAAVLDAGGINNPHGIVTTLADWMATGRTGIVDIGVIEPHNPDPTAQHTGIGLMGQWYESGGRAGGAGRTADYFPIIGHPPDLENAKGPGAYEAAKLSWRNILVGNIGGQFSRGQKPPIDALFDVLKEQPQLSANVNKAVRMMYAGGTLMEPVAGRGLNSGMGYMFGEGATAERVTERGASGNTYHIYITANDEAGGKAAAKGALSVISDSQGAGKTYVHARRRLGLKAG